MSTRTSPADNRTGGRPAARLNPVVFYGSAVGVVAIAIWAIVARERAAETIGHLVGWTSEWFGWFYILFATVVLVFVVCLGLSRYGGIKLGPQHSKPQYSTFAWVSMLFAAGIGTDLMFFAVAEPVSQYLAPPVGEGQTVEAARRATVWTLFHYGISGWGMYALMGMALAYFSYRMNLPLAVRSALYPIAGKRIRGGLGHAVDIAAVLGTIFGVATSLGIGVVQLNYGLDALFGIPEGRPAQIGLIALAVSMATLSAVSGVDKGIKLLSKLTVVLALGLVGFILLAGDTVFLLNALVLNIGDYASSFPALTLETFAYERPVAWLNSWTLFFWAWWVAWASFVGLFLARISRGRTIRQFVAGTLLLPFCYVLAWVSVFGNSAIDAIRDGDQAFGELAMLTPEHGFYTLLMDYPVFPLVAGVATFVGLLFYVTSADSGALVMANLCSTLPTPQTDGAKGVRIFWAVATGVLTGAMLVVGGVPALQNATVVMGLPFAFVMVLVMVGLYRALQGESRRAADHALRVAGLPMAKPVTAAARARTHEFLDEVAQPALEEASEELRARGVEVRCHRLTQDGAPYVEVVANPHGGPPFRYRIGQREVPSSPVPGARGGDRRYRLEARLAGDARAYDVLGMTHTQVVDDVLGQYERHLERAPVQGQGAGL